VALAPDVLDQLASTWDVSGTVAQEMFARLAGPDYRRWQAQAARCGFCAHPIRLHGRVVDGDGAIAFTTADKPDGVLLKRCGNRRRSVCPACSFLYAGDMWHLLFAGLAGGDKGVPPGVHDHPMVFATLTAPGFGPVHSTRSRNGKPQRCRPRREGTLCPHGRPTWCMAIHDDTDHQVGTPICPDCYDHVAAVLFNWWAPELWRRFTIDLYRTLATRLGLGEADFKRTVRISYAKVAEAQARGVVHFHAIIRLDANGDGWQPPPLRISVETLSDAVRQACERTTLTVPALDHRVKLRFGPQVDVQPIRHRADLEEGELEPGKVAAYISKYATKGPDDFGITTHRLDTQTARHLHLPEHSVRMIDAACELAKVDDYRRLSLWTHTYGFRGHFATHSRRYSTTLTALRAARSTHARRQARRHPDTTDNDDGDLVDVIEYIDADDDTTLLVGEWRFAGVGYTTDGDARLAALSEAEAREWRPYIAQAIREQRRERESWTSEC